MDKTITSNRPPARWKPVLGTVVFFFLAPCVVTGLVPWLFTRWQLPARTSMTLGLHIAGVLLLFAGAFVLLDCFARFAWKGLGTPAPVYPTRMLVVTDFYRFVRNPMYLAVVALVLAQAALFQSWRLLLFASLTWVATHFFVLFYEEPKLRKTFPKQYKELPSCAALDPSRDCVESVKPSTKNAVATTKDAQDSPTCEEDSPRR